MTIYKKILCACLGHKTPEATKGIPYTTLGGAPIDGKYYVWDTFLCERCVMFHKYNVYTQKEWETILIDRSNNYLNELESIIKNSLKSIPYSKSTSKQYNSSDDVIIDEDNTSPTSKLVH